MNIHFIQVLVVWDEGDEVDIKRRKLMVEARGRVEFGILKKTKSSEKCWKQLMTEMKIGRFTLPAGPFLLHLADINLMRTDTTDIISLNQSDMAIDLNLAMFIGNVRYYVHTHRRFSSNNDLLHDDGVLCCRVISCRVITVLQKRSMKGIYARSARQMQELTSDRMNSSEGICSPRDKKLCVLYVKQKKSGEDKKLSDLQEIFIQHGHDQMRLLTVDNVSNQVLFHRVYFFFGKSCCVCENSASVFRLTSALIAP